tara:strand:- start:206 stop:787 length:582 start_codon:yes stop_codon:yes gene_type:complete
MNMQNIKQVLGESGRTISNKDRGLASMMDNEPKMQDRSPEGQMFAIESEIKNMMKDYEVAVRSGDNQRAQMIADQIGKLEKMKIKIQGGMANMAIKQQMAEGGEAQMQMSEQEAMAELEAAKPDFEIIEKLVMAVVQMISQGMDEAEVREYLREQGLDNEDMEELFQMVAERLQKESQAPAEELIGKQLQGIM